MNQFYSAGSSFSKRKMHGVRKILPISFRWILFWNKEEKCWNTISDREKEIKKFQSWNSFSHFVSPDKLNAPEDNLKVVKCHDILSHRKSILYSNWKWHRFQLTGKKRIASKQQFAIALLTCEFV